MTTELKTIDQAGVRSLLRERLDNPGAFIGKPLIIWRSYINDGVNDVIARDVFKEYNNGRQRDLRKGFWPNPKNVKKDNLGICVIDTSADYSRAIENYSDCPMVVFAFVDSPDDSVLADFPDAGQYVFAPDFQQWAARESLTKDHRLVIDFINSTCNRDSVTYRWYNYFNNDIRHISHRKGCDFPARWLDGLGKLRMYLKIARLKKLGDVSEDFFVKSFVPYISVDLIEEFRKYILDNQL